MKPLIFLALVILAFAGCKHKTAEDYFKEAETEVEATRKIDLLSKAIELKPDFFDAISERGFLYQSSASTCHGLLSQDKSYGSDAMKYYKLCISDYERCINLKPNDALTYFRRGVIECEMGDTNMGCLDFKKATALGEDCSEDIKEYCK